MAELQTQSGVPARWRIVFAAFLPLAFFAAMLFLSRPGPTPSGGSAPRSEPDANARIRLETVAVAFSAGKLSPDFAIVTDRPEVYVPPDSDATIRKFWPRVPENGFDPGPDVALPREFGPLFSTPAVVDLRNETAREAFLNDTRFPGRFDMILLDCAFPARVTSPEIDLWTTKTLGVIARKRASAGAVFAVALPQYNAAGAACIAAAMENLFGNIGTFCFGERVIAASSVPLSAATPITLKDVFRKAPREDEAENAPRTPLFALTDINKLASDAGYYFPALSEVPEDAIVIALEQDYSEAPPVGLMEEAENVRRRSGRTVGTLAYAKAELLPRLRGRLPGGLPYGKLCAWALGIGLFAYLLLRYFISWKPVHKQAFQAFEDMFCLTGCLALFCAALLDFSMSRHPLSWFWLGMFPLCSIILLAQAQWQERSPFSSRPARVKRKVPRFVYALLGGLFYVLAFRLIRFESHDLIHVAGVGFFMLAVGVFLDLNQGRIVKPVQPGTAIPLAFILGVAASLAVFAVCLLFPSGPAVFAALLCFRIVFLEN